MARPARPIVRFGLLGLFIACSVLVLTFGIAHFLPVENISDPQFPALEAGAVPLVTEDDPKLDGWDTEVFSQTATVQLLRLAKALSSHPVKQDVVAAVLDSKFSGHALLPPRDRVYQDGQLEIRRLASTTTSDSENPTLPSLGIEQWIGRLSEFTERIADASETNFEVKVLGVSKQAHGYATDVRFVARARGESLQLQVQAMWRCRWSMAANSVPRLTSIQIRDYEEVSRRGRAGLFVADCTKSVMDRVECYDQQLVPGYEAWFRRTPKIFDRVLWGDHGLVVGDVNGDGRDDLYICEPGSLPNRLLIQQQDGTVKDVSAAAGVDWLDQTRSALLVDLDNDGDQDLVVALSGAILFMENDGTGRFHLRAKSKDAPAAHAMAAADFDLDGRLDIYACSYFKESYAADEYRVAVPYHNATNGGRNVLLRNVGNWRFKNVTSDVGLDQANNRWSLAAAWEDYDNDGDSDLYIANDFGRNCLYRNDRGKFSNAAAAAGVEDVGSGMSVAWGDYNRDGWMDLYVSNMFSAAGSRITSQQKFKPGIDPGERAIFQRMAKGNSLFLNVGDGTFRDVSREAGVAMARWAWGAPFADINNDGWEDLIVANGFITRDDPRDL